MKYRLADICDYVKERKINFDESNYVSMENMFSNRGGIIAPSNVPGGSAIAYAVNV